MSKAESTAATTRDAATDDTDTSSSPPGGKIGRGIGPTDGQTRDGGGTEVPPPVKDGRGL